ncbi:MAG: 6-bladed beta-propeller [Candidatus Aminicenantes bacterium]
MKPDRMLFVVPVLFGVLMSSFAASPGAVRSDITVLNLKAVATTVPGERPDDAFLARPVALAFDEGMILVADAQDCAIKVFAEDGSFVRSIGRKGAGPGEFSFPSGVCVSGGRIFVADKFNFRVQILDREGKPEGGFRLDFPPDKIYALGERTILVTSNPSGRPVRENMLHLFDPSGALLWEGLESRSFGDPVYDTFRNMFLVCPDGSGGFFIVFRSEERAVLHFGPKGDALGGVPVDERYAFKPVRLPFKGPTKVLLGFCWSAAFDRERLYLLEPEAVEDRDLGPGRRVSVLGRDGRMQAVIDLPRRIHRFTVDGDRIYALDEEGELGVFEVAR